MTSPRTQRRDLRALAVLALAALSWFAFAPRAALAQPKPLGKVTADCVETIPSGATRPDVDDDFPEEGIAGFASNLVVTLRHGKGETPLPSGYKIVPQSQAARTLLLNGFAIIDVDSDTAITVETKSDGDSAVSKVTIPVILLPLASGNLRMKLPSLPIPIARADGEVMTVCTSPHEIDSLDPILEEKDPQVRPNPDARHQKEPWVLLQVLLPSILVALVLLLIAAYFLRKHLRKPKPEVVIPKRVPWEVALEELQALRGSKMLEEGKLDEYFDAVSDCVRKYLGSRYGFEELGFEGLDTTTDEMRALLKRVKPRIAHLDLIGSFLDDCDLVKFARLTPNADECTGTLTKGEAIVKGTMPQLGPTGKPIVPGATGAVPVPAATQPKPPEDGPPTDPSPPPTQGGDVGATQPSATPNDPGGEARP